MGNEPNADPNGETPNGTVPQGETPPLPNGETPGGTTPTSPDDVQKELRRLQAGLERANKEAKEYRIKAEELDKLKADADASKLSETEKLQKQLAATQAEKERITLQVQELRVGSTIQLQAMQQGIDPTLASKLVDRAEVEYDGLGNPTNVAALLKALITQYPTLVGKTAAAPTSGGATNPSRTQSGAPPEITREYIATLTAEDYARLPRETQLRIAQINYDQPWKRH